MANKYTKIILPFSQDDRIQLNCDYYYVKNKIKKKRTIYLTYLITRWSSETPIHLELFMESFVTRVIDICFVPIQNNSVFWSRIVLKSIPNTVTFHYHFGETKGIQPDPAKWNEMFQFALQLKTNKITYLNLYSVPSNIMTTSTDSLSKSESILLDPLDLVEDSIRLELVGLKKNYLDEIISITSNGIKPVLNAVKLKKPIKRKKVTKKQKKKHVIKPLREPIGQEIFQGLLQQPRGHKKKLSSFYRFRLITVLLYFTGMRLSEIGNLTEKQIRELQHNQKTQIFSPKQNKMIFVVVSSQIKPMLDQMETDIQYTFYDSFKAKQHEYLKRNEIMTNFVGWYNRQLKYYLKQYNETVKSKELEQNIQYLSSHSFRINRITQLLRHHMPIEKVQNLIGHANIATTEKYYRWKPNSQDLIQELTDIEQIEMDTDQ